MPVLSGTSLEVLDWGGHGGSLVFLAGLGNTAHIFDDLAPSLTDSFHVYGITRRGFGRSTQPPDSDIASSVNDLRIVSDSLGLSKVILVGHSIAGFELTAFAGSHPDRCQALVYLDAAYDPSQSARAALNRMRWPHRPAMTAVDSATPAAVQAYFARTGRVRPPEADLRAVARFDSGGRYIGDVTPDSLALLMTRHLLTPAYERLPCPSLAIYAVSDSARALIPWYAQLDSAGRADAERYFPVWRAWQQHSITQYRRSAPFSHVVEIHDADHYVFLSNRAETIRAVRAFLAVIRASGKQPR
ncbi:MAG TPA: alpha/beta hydrolase [Gemmatimonadales bacterium]|nr:alpha/beta hydrolase [Gemmatimonadales bacterium]